MAYGEEVVDAVVANAVVRAIDNCTGVSSGVSRQMYGVAQDDNNVQTIANDNDIVTALRWTGQDNDTALWRFEVLNPLHYFVVLPWIHRGDGNHRAFTVLMAYEGHYTVGQYTGAGGGNNVPPAGNTGYVRHRTVAQMTTMLRAIRDTAGARADYFGVGGNQAANPIRYWKYGVITARSAMKRLG